ncbi:general substrate transporter [Lipomyces japonicus]|uniref:general substrate transporter n=1 Tax=Lipomyces japonicus TaxID=56871 RepID=UPI0034CE4B0E
MQGCANNLGTLMAGRFFLGFGSALMSAPQYMAEISPVHLRGRLVGIFGACFQVGSLVMSGINIGLTEIDSNWCWRIPFLLQGLFPLIFCLAIFWLAPESPRYYILRDREEDARKVIAKYHTTSGELDHPLVEIVIQQMRDSVHRTETFKQFWDFRIFFTRKVGFRTLVLVLYSIFQQWNGGGIISTYLVPTLETVGIDQPRQQLGINLGLTAVYLIFTLAGSYLVDKIRRRTMLFLGLVSFVLLQTASTISSWQYLETGSKAAASLSILWIFLFQTFSSLFIATMHNLYPVEILSLPLRAKGMALYGVIQGAAGTINTYGISVGISKIGYKIYTVFIVYNTIQLLLVYFLFPETSKLSLEEIDSVFETPGVSPVKMSLKIEKTRRKYKKNARANLASGAD